MKKIFTDEQVQFIIDNYDRMEYKQIAERLGNFTERQVRGKINGLGLSKLRKFNDTYFSKIDTGNKAYWLGFIYADGWIINRPNDRIYELAIELQQGDAYILENLSEELGGAHPVTHHHNHKTFNGYKYETDSARLRIYSKRIVNDLISLGVVENKTNASQYPKCDVFVSDFIRGYLDGDGCIYIGTRHGHECVSVSFTCSNRDFLDYINQKIYSEIGVLGRIYTEKDKKHRLIFYKNEDVKVLLDWIYKNSNASMLTRKYEKYSLAYGLAA